MPYRLLHVILIYLFLLPIVLYAQEEKQETLGLVTGPHTGTYIAFGKDIAALARSQDLEVRAVSSGGSIENIKHITDSQGNAPIGIVQSDVLSFLKRSQKSDSQKISRQLRMVLPFYQEEVHLLARRTITSTDDLNGARVVIGGAGSGSMLTSINLLSLLGIVPAKMYQVSPPEGLVAVLNDEADAMVFVGGKPVRLFKNMEDLAHITEGANAGKLDQVHFLPLDASQLKDEYAAASITPEDYSYVAETVPTIAVTAMLVAYDFSAKKTSLEKLRCGQIGKLVTIIRDNLGFLKANSHPKWHEVDLDADIGAPWKRDRCAWPAEE